jgi:hypothetical protein
MLADEFDYNALLDAIVEVEKDPAYHVPFPLQ